MAPPRRSKGRSTLEQVFGQVLRQLREEARLSQEQLGLESESGRTYISQLERGEKGPSLKMIFKLAPHLGCRPAEIVRQVEEALAAD